MATALSGFQKDLANTITIAYISSLPAIIRRDMTSWENSLNMPKYPCPPGIPRATPVLASIPIEVVMVVSISRSLKDSRMHPIANIPKNSMVWVVMEDAILAGTGFPSIMTALTIFGCICCSRPLFMSLNSTVTLMTLREPDVEKEQPPMNSSRTSMVEAKDGHAV